MSVVPVVRLVGAEIVRRVALGSLEGPDALEALQAHHNQKEEAVRADETNRAVGWGEHGLVPLIVLALIAIEV